MERQARKMLEFITEYCEAEKYLMFRDLYEDYGRVSSLPNTRMIACVNHLIAEGYMSVEEDSKGNAYAIRPNHKAFRKAAFTREAVKQFFIRSFITPIIVSVATTFATMWLTGFFQ